MRLFGCLKTRGVKIIKQTDTNNWNQFTQQVLSLLFSPLQWKNGHCYVPDSWFIILHLFSISTYFKSISTARKNYMNKCQSWNLVLFFYLGVHYQALQCKHCIMLRYEMGKLFQRGLPIKYRNVMLRYEYHLFIYSQLLSSSSSKSD